jgi:uncharacterized protein (TIGR03435 family)
MPRTLRVTALALMAAANSFAQSAGAAPKFKVASIKPNTSTGQSSSINIDHVEIFVRNSTLHSIVQYAFSTRSFGVAAPDWLSTTRFDVTARFAAGTSRAECKAMMQELLIERFKLETHRETKRLQGYAITLAKSEPKIRPVEDTGGRNADTGGDRFKMEQVSMAQFAGQLTGRLGQPVEDATRLKGVFTFNLTYTPERGLDENSAQDSGPSIFTAVQEQLGLKLEARKIPVEILVVDHCERVPTEN